MSEVLFKEQSFQIMGACFEVHNKMGGGFVEPVYQECLAIEMGLRGIPFAVKQQVELQYKDRILKQEFEPDFVCFEQIIIEIKAVTSLCDEHRAQVLNYLHVTRFKLGLLVNFGTHPKLQHERFVL